MAFAELLSVACTAPQYLFHVIS